MRLKKRSDPYSHRYDPAVPDFDDRGPITFMDGDCTLCSIGARMIARFDHKAEFRICPVQTDLGRSVLLHYGLDADDPESWLYLEDGQAFTSLEAMIRAGRRVSGIGWLLQPLRVLPRPVQDWLYARLARNRYAIFGRTDICAIPDQRLKDRLIG